MLCLILPAKNLHYRGYRSIQWSYEHQTAYLSYFPVCYSLPSAQSSLDHFSRFPCTDTLYAARGVQLIQSFFCSKIWTMWTTVIAVDEWKFLDYKMHCNVDGEDPASVQRQSVIRSLLPIWFFALSDLVRTIKLYGHITTSFSRSELLAGKMPVLLMLGDMTHPVLWKRTSGHLSDFMNSV